MKIRLSRSVTASHITLPNLAPPYPSLLDFLVQRFPFVGHDVWLHRLESGKISDEKGKLVTADTAYRINARLRYFREVLQEQPIPFQETILFQNESFLIADKPHFLPVTPSGNYVNECLLHRLKLKTGLEHLTAAHRLDRETAGLVLFVCNKEYRRAYFKLFQQRNIKKYYEAVATLPDQPEPSNWLIESRIEQAEPRIRYQNSDGEINARSRIRLVETRGKLAKFELEPMTGKTHQLRLHLGLIGSHIIGDRLYPECLTQRSPCNFDNPLQLLAKQLSFTDPISGEKQQFESRFRLNW